jgi:hypothetical protein
MSELKVNKVTPRSGTTVTIGDSGEHLALAGNIGLGGATPTTSGTGITFPATASPSTNANTLDDYEEGTWTPSVTAQTGTLTTTSSTGSYTKIGKAVTVNFRITITDAGTGTNGLFISNFPFAAATATTLSAAAREDTGVGINITASATSTTTLAFFNGGSTMIGSSRAFSCSTTYFTS